MVLGIASLPRCFDAEDLGAAAAADAVFAVLWTLSFLCAFRCFGGRLYSLRRVLFYFTVFFEDLLNGFADGHMWVLSSKEWDRHKRTLQRGRTKVSCQYKLN